MEDNGWDAVWVERTATGEDEGINSLENIFSNRTINPRED
jgi:hypothetical protein